MAKSYLDDPWQITAVLEEFFCIMACDCEARQCKNPTVDECKVRFTNAMLQDLEKAFQHEKFEGALAASSDGRRKS